ncbi:NVEALA domain-containing protein [Bacteroides fragilis]|nr:NVEALA domain-containing protein [Bacteroides hominis (ex Liu et al. 2022)]MCS2831505.1 NVEALA domain-containing protein [Bacteroides fragilis]
MIAFIAVIVISFTTYNVYKAQKKKMHLSALAIANV